MEKITDVSSLSEYLKNIITVGFQSSHIGEARDLLKEMFSTTLFLSFTANLVATGMRGYIKELVKNKKVSAIITTAGALEHDVMRSFSYYYKGDFSMDDSLLNKEGINRIGNVLIKNESYEILEKINNEIFSKNEILEPSLLAEEYGKYIEKNSDKRETSFLYHAYKNNIPVFCPGIVDGAIGLNAYFYKKASPSNKLVFDLVKDLEKLGEIILNAEETSGLIIGGGISKHHLLGSNIIRGGLDYAIYISTAVEYDGSLSGAKPKEAVSWGKLKQKKHILINGEASLILPLLLEGML